MSKIGAAFRRFFSPHPTRGVGILFLSVHLRMSSGIDEVKHQSGFDFLVHQQPIALTSIHKAFTLPGAITFKRMILILARERRAGLKNSDYRIKKCKVKTSFRGALTTTLVGGGNSITLDATWTGEPPVKPIPHGAESSLNRTRTLPQCMTRSANLPNNIVVLHGHASRSRFSRKVFGVIMSGHL